ncbi:MAG: MFS transporter [Flavobacteriales bacterium]|nr:MFS transporter [Flavobacteriales bacterium]
MTEQEAKKKKKENALVNIAVNVIIPSVIMSKFSNEEYFGEVNGLLIALTFPLGYGIRELLIHKKFNVFSILGLVSVLLTGGIGLLSLDRKWMVIKETAIPLIIGVVVIASQRTNYKLVPKLFSSFMDFDKIKNAFLEKGEGGAFQKKINFSSYLIGGSFFLSALLNYLLAVWILVGDPGSAEFNESLGKMTALSFPVIAIPMMVVTGLILYDLISMIKKVTGLEMEDFIKTE